MVYCWRIRSELTSELSILHYSSMKCRFVSAVWGMLVLLQLVFFCFLSKLVTRLWDGDPSVSPSLWSGLESQQLWDGLLWRFEQTFKVPRGWIPLTFLQASPWSNFFSEMRLLCLMSACWWRTAVLHGTRHYSYLWGNAVNERLIHVSVQFTQLLPADVLKLHWTLEGKAVRSVWCLCFCCHESLQPEFMIPFHLVRLHLHFSL